MIFPKCPLLMPLNRNWNTSAVHPVFLKAVLICWGSQVFQNVRGLVHRGLCFACRTVQCRCSG